MTGFVAGVQGAPVPRLWPPPGLSVTHQASNCLVFNLQWVVMVTVCWAKYYSTKYEKQKYNIAISFYFSQRIVKVLFLDSVIRFFRLWLELNEWQKLSIALNLYLFGSDLQASSSLQEHIKNIPEHFRRIFL